MPHKEKLVKKQRNTRIILISSLIGFFAGWVNVGYRWVLTQAEHLSFEMYDFIASHLAYLPVLLIGLAATGYFLGWLTQKFPLIGGSGIPQVKGTIMGYLSGNWVTTLLAKFLGGTLSILGGLSLGREGPSIQLGACVAEGVSKKCTTDVTERRIYIASGASAGLAAAFNAPLAGVMFALEEIFRYFSPMILLSTLLSAVVADFISKLVFGTDPVFHFAVVERLPLQYYWLFVILGAVLGLCGVIYNRCIVKAQARYKAATWLKPRFRPILPLLLAGILGILFPVVLCGGHAVIEELSLSTSLLLLLAILVVKFLFSMVSFGSGAPGGIFFPLLILGATIGAIFAKVAMGLLGLDDIYFYNFLILAMAGYFTAIVRAPLTGVILLLEMTGSFQQLLPLIIVSTVAYVVAEELHCEPIYESLLENLLANMGIHQAPEDGSKLLLEAVVQLGSRLDGAHLMDVDIPSHCLVVAIKRGEHEITPNGHTPIQAGDYLTILTDVSNESTVQSALERLVQAKGY